MAIEKGIIASARFELPPVQNSSPAIEQPDTLISAIALQIERKPAFDLEVEELDRIADGLELEEESVLICREGWFDTFLDSLSWWRIVAEGLLSSDRTIHTLFPEPAFAEDREALLKLHHEVLVAFGPAWQEDWFFSADWNERGEAARELLKRYRAFTRYVCGFAQELRPAADLGSLLKLA
jgi:hypothetical protein